MDVTKLSLQERKYLARQLPKKGTKKVAATRQAKLTNKKHEKNLPIRRTRLSVKREVKRFNSRMWWEPYVYRTTKDIFGLYNTPMELFGLDVVQEEQKNGNSSVNAVMEDDEEETNKENVVSINKNKDDDGESCSIVSGTTTTTATTAISIQKSPSKKENNKEKAVLVVVSKLFESLLDNDKTNEDDEKCSSSSATKKNKKKATNKVVVLKFESLLEENLHRIRELGLLFQEQQSKKTKDVARI